MAHIPITFNRVRALLSSMFNFAGIDPNPCRRVPRFRETQRRRYLSGEEYARLAKALCDHEDIYPGPVAFLRLLLMLGCRSSELLRAKRAWLKDSILTLPEHKTSDKTGPKEIYFPPAALAIVTSLAPRRGWLLGFETRPTIYIDKIIRAAELDDFVVHDLRHSFASEALSSGYTLDQIGQLLGHTDVQTTQRYAHLVRTAKHAAADDIASKMATHLLHGHVDLKSEAQGGA